MCYHKLNLQTTHPSVDLLSESWKFLTQKSQETKYSIHLYITYLKCIIFMYFGNYLKQILVIWNTQLLFLRLFHKSSATYKLGVILVLLR